jgi:hypothetical protein
MTRRPARLAPGGFYYANARMEYGFARGEPVPVEPALGN